MSLKVRRPTLPIWKSSTDNNKNTNGKFINHITSRKTKQNGVVWYYSQWTHSREKFTSHCIFLEFLGRISGDAEEMLFSITMVTKRRRVCLVMPDTTRHWESKTFKPMFENKWLSIEKWVVICSFPLHLIVISSKIWLFIFLGMFSGGFSEDIIFSFEIFLS